MKSPPVARSAAVEAALVAGVIAGIVDIGVAALINHASPGLILQAISSGVLGLSAYAARWTIALGLLLQLCMSIAIAGIFVGGALRLPLLRRRPVLIGLAYGVGIFIVMNFIVVPLSAFEPKPAHVTLTWLLLNVAAMLLFGVLVAIVAMRVVERRR